MSNKKYCTVVMVVCRLWREDAQTDRTYHRHGCGGDSDALTCGVATPQAMVGAKAARRHGRTQNTKIIKVTEIGAIST